MAAEAMSSRDWAGIVSLGVDKATVARWDPGLVRRPRVLVPIDVQALFVPQGDRTKFVRLPFALTTPDNTDVAPMPAPLAEGEPRAPGVHLHWAPPDALLRGSLEDVPEGATNRLGLPALPDRWVVVRTLVPRGSLRPHVRGWVIEADTTKVVPLEDWPSGAASAAPTGKTLPPEQITGTAGGTLNWSAVYDAVVNRFGFHDPLDDLATAAPSGVHGNLATYSVAGWWSQSKLDPLDRAGTTASLHERLRELRWSLLEDAEGGDLLELMARQEEARWESLGLYSGDRYGQKPGERFEVRRSDGPGATVDATHAFQPAISVFGDEVASVVGAKRWWRRSSLLHGVVYGVPVTGSIVRDQRPDADRVGVVFGLHEDDLSSTLATGGIGAIDHEERRGYERILSAFTGQLLPQLGTADGVVMAEEHEHGAAFASLPGGDAGVERLRPAGEAGPLPAGRAARRAADPKKTPAPQTEVTLEWAGRQRSDLLTRSALGLRDEVEAWEKPLAPVEPDVEAGAREVRRPGPRYHVPIDPMVAVRGPKRSLRHHGDGRFSPDGLLHCRWPSQVPTGIEGLLDGSELVPSLPSGGIPLEVLSLVRSAVVQDPYLVPWLSAFVSGRRHTDGRKTETRMAAEAAVRFGRDGIYDGSVRAFRSPSKHPSLAASALTDQIRRFSLVAGVDADPVAVTAWSQPWVPLWLEWEVELGGSDRFEGWKLGAVDFDPPKAEDGQAAASRTFSGRSPLHAGTARTLSASIAGWLEEEEERDVQDTGEADEATEDALADIAGAIRYLDVLTASLDGLRDRLLGLPVSDYGVLHERDGSNGLKKPVPVDVPQLLVTGALRLARARLVDAFGRTLDLPVQAARVPAREEAAAGPPVELRLRPRLTRPARWMFRLVDPADLGDTSPEATIDQVDPTRMVNPVAGFLLPDHIDEALEVFDTAGQPIGQLMHESFGGGVVWEIAPGRTGPADAGPLHGLANAQAVLGHLAAGMVAADTSSREGKSASPEIESSLSAFLRAVDTTLWSVDTFGTFGNEHIAGLVGRPIAVVRALLWLDIDDDLDELDLSGDGARAAREAAYRALADRAFPVRLGELTRSDDGLLAFFVDDDYRHVHVVDRAVRDGALDGGRGRGHQGRYGTGSQIPPVRPIDHDYVVAEDELLVHPGQVVRLTLLMHPTSRVHLTSGLLPRKSLQLARDWVRPGLAVMAPSARIGPVLIEPGDVRLPKISVFPKEQIWTRRTTPYTWKDDPILAATQTALLPDMPAEFQEGYIRISPKPEGSGS
jgi:hypothetical protein